jgi:CRISPR-associated protein (TIGR03986 family)
MMTKSNNKRPLHSNPSGNRIAHAPYNFVPLPERIVTVEKEKLPGHDSYAEGTYTGWFDCEMETCSPVYVRGMQTLEQRAKHAEQEEQEDRETDMQPEERRRRQVKRKEERAHFYSARPEEEVEGHAVPMIPGSSLRGLTRSLVEIISCGRMRWVNDSPKLTFRAVAAPREDPLSEPYRELIGAFSKHVKAGYLKTTQTGDWEIKPALTPRDMGWPENTAFLKLKEARIPNGVITDFVRFNSPNYWPEYYFVSFDASTRRGRRGQFISIDRIGDDADNYTHRGTLVCTGNMVESAPQEDQGGFRQPSPRSSHALVLMENAKKPALEINSRVLQDYKDSLTQFQRDELWKPGGLEDGAPIFYIEKSGQLIWFGHTPNFRVPALNDDDRAATPLDFIPKAFHPDPQPDLAQAIFGWVEEVNFKLTERSLSNLSKAGVPEEVLKRLRGILDVEFSKRRFLDQVERKIDDVTMAEFRESIIKHAEKDNVEGQRAGRVFFGDAHFVKASAQGVWYRKQPTTPSTLSSPKITTFQHYLAQDKEMGHDPNNRAKLAHYGSKSGESEIRGFKLYWHKGDQPDIDATADELRHDKQLTRIIPIRPGVCFKFRVCFENLRDYELGAVAWTLQLPEEEGKTYRHKLGMGKPLGMGAVKITPKLHLTERRNKQSGRYSQLFGKDGCFASGESESGVNGFISAFQDQVAPEKKKLTEINRIRMLLTMLQWRGGEKEWCEQTRYMKIELSDPNAKGGNRNEYQNRPVLPDPLAVSGEE